MLIDGSILSSLAPQSIPFYDVFCIMFIDDLFDDSVHFVLLSVMVIVFQVNLTLLFGIMVILIICFGACRHIGHLV